jgi:formyl-CoA transferase
LATDPRFITHRIRVENYDAINEIVAKWIKSTAVDRVTAAFRANGVPHSLIYSPVEISVDPHYAARGSIATLDHPRLGPLKMPAAVPRFSATPAPPFRAAPLLGEDTDDVLADLLHLSGENIASLRKEGII